MGEPLKNHFGPDVPTRIAAAIAGVYPKFQTRDFVRASLKGYEPLGLTARGWQIAEALREFLPADTGKGMQILIKSLGPILPRSEANGMAPFLYMPHAFYVGKYGLDHFDIAMKAQLEITQRFTAEFSIRPFLQRFPDKTLAQLHVWTEHASPHVRRLVSEGTRPRLPWAPRLPAFQADPRPVLALLELLKDDPELYVRRSVANNLNDIGKDHPAILADTARRWLQGAPPERAALVRHALRSAIKRGEPGALGALGAGKEAAVTIRAVSLQPKQPRIGSSIQIGFNLSSAAKRSQRVVVDLRIHFVKANGKTSPKTFKLKTLDLARQDTVQLGKKISLAQQTTRTHYPGKHQVEAIVNGRAIPLGAFELRR